MQQQLAQHLLEHVLPLFKGAPRLQHPWWWPKGLGESRLDWIPGSISDDDIEVATGLSVQQVVDSLRFGTGGEIDAVAEDDYQRFRGFMGDGPADRTRVVVVTVNPSVSAYPTGTMTVMMRRLAELGLMEAHVTNVIKRRGGLMTHGEDLEFHIRLFLHEVSLLTSDGRDVMVVPAGVKAQRFFKKHGVVARLETRSSALRVPSAPAYLLYGSRKTTGEVLASWRAVLEARTSAG